MTPNGGSISKLPSRMKSPQSQEAKVKIGEQRRRRIALGPTGSNRISSLAKRLDVPILV